MIGTFLGPYQVVAKLGEGGMGQVFRATDTKLKRQVAIKILPPSLAADHDRLARFQREAEVLASLNHPHIAGIYGLEESDGVSALVMELVDGEDLSQRIARGAIPIDEALPIAKQIADALEAAHEQGIIHRDLKPAAGVLRSRRETSNLYRAAGRPGRPAEGWDAGAISQEQLRRPNPVVLARRPLAGLSVERIGKE
jgi:serine/threonine protein kinase